MWCFDYSGQSDQPELLSELKPSELASATGPTPEQGHGEESMREVPQCLASSSSSAAGGEPGI